MLAGAVSCGRVGFSVVDATIDAGDDACPLDALLCDDFETQDISRWDTVLTDGGGTAMASTQRARSGSSALELRYGASSTSGIAAVVLQLTPRSTGVLAVREWIYLEQPLAAFNLVVAFGNTATGQFITAGGNSSARWVSTDQDANRVIVDHTTGVATPPVGEWTCVELVVDYVVNGPPTVELFVAGARILDTAIADVNPLYDHVEVGLSRADRAGYVLYVDDVVIDDARIGCGP